MPMCRLLIVVATVVPMLIHSILGCCWHHAHAAMPVGSCEQSDKELSGPDRLSKCCGHGHPRDQSPAVSDVAKSSSRSTEQTSDPCCPDDEQSPCDEDRCVVFWAESTKQKIGLPGRILELATDQTFESVSCQSMNSVRLLVLQAPQINAASPRARTQVWIV